MIPTENLYLKAIRFSVSLSKELKKTETGKMESCDEF